MKIPVVLALLCFAAVTLPYNAWCVVAPTCDQYSGDSWIYSGVSSSIKANVLIIIDTSGSMKSATEMVAGGSYDPTVTYADSKKCGEDRDETCLKDTIYRTKDNDPISTGKTITSVTTSCQSLNPNNLLATLGIYTGKLNTSSLACDTGTDTRTFRTGNYINYLSSGGSLLTKIDIARNVVKDLILTTSGVNFGVMRFNTNDEGATFVQNTVDGSPFTTTIPLAPLDMDSIFAGTTTYRTALKDTVLTFTADGTTPLAESLYEAGQYFKGAETKYGNTVGLTGSPLKYTSPITSSCQKNYIIVVTDGMPNNDNTNIPSNLNATTLPSPIPSDACPGSNCLAGVARHLYNTDLLTDVSGKPETLDKQNVTTFTIGFNAGATADALLAMTADSKHGNGAFYTAFNQFDLSERLNQIMSSILSVDISFVAPVVPISPDNRTYNSNRIYMGFFKPRGTLEWQGNLKKYGLDSNNQIIDKNGIAATGLDGSFKLNSVSYWNTTEDAGVVAKGGAGEKLMSRTIARNIYTYTGKTSSDPTLLTDAANAFTTTNTKITPAVLNDTGLDKDKLINYVHGLDSYGITPTAKRDWILGDILHSKPLVVNYKTYDTDVAANETNPAVNKSVIFVGSNDGMLHAINDHDGSEAWAFIPPAILGDLKEITTSMHTYTVDSSPTVYIYDQNADGNIDTSTDKVIMMIGLRRGAGKKSSPTNGSYYALDVTDPAAPKYLWEFSNSTTGFAELGESWSEPKIVKLKIGSATKIAAFIGGGYDNANEDSRFGATQNFTGTGSVTLSTSGNDSVISTPISPAVAALNPKGRAVYAVEIATLSSAGVPTIATSPTKIWGAEGAVTCSTSPAVSYNMDFSVASDITTLDVDGNGFVDRLYVTDLGGNLWRFDVGSTTTTSWTGCKIFNANPGFVAGVAVAADTGRKFFYKPVATLENTITSPTRGNDAMILIGSGDREHPLNTSVVDRAYAVRDKGQLTTKTEADLLDVTTDQLQAATGTQADIDTAVNSALATLASSSNYGWYMRLEPYIGEKILAPPALLNKVAYFTSFTPGTSIVVDPCKPNNLGTSRLYVLNYATAEAVTNYDTTNDATVTLNKRAKSSPTGYTLLRSDRVKTIGSGIASGVVIVRDKAFIGAGGSILTENIKKGGRIINLYWGQK